MKIFNDHSIIKDEMLAILNGIETEIDSTLSNNNRAMQTLGVDRASGGWCELFYSNEAEELWNKQLKTTPDDQETLHHLAILHHARAFDLEFSDKSSKSDTDWSKAWKIWEQILKQDDFLERFSGSIVGIDIETFTKPFIEKIVAIHFAFA
ncbi:MAG: hypothetical protein HOM80_02330, partial [Bacteroidetes bacterium]|nr:hypothetical protein [Bacteroidota bacterium]